jgi:hypothetical protein
MRWDAELRTWLPLDPPSGFPEVVAEIAVPSVQASMTDSGIQIQISDSVMIQREYRVNFAVLWKDEEVFTGTIPIPSGGDTLPVTYFRNREQGLSIVQEIDLSFKLEGWDSSCAISIPPGVPDELQPNFTRLSLVVSSLTRSAVTGQLQRSPGGTASLRFERDLLIETEIEYREYYEVQLNSPSVNEELEFYFGLRRGMLECHGGINLKNILLEEPGDSFDIVVGKNTNWEILKFGEFGAQAWGGWSKNTGYHFLRTMLIISNSECFDELPKWRDPDNDGTGNSIKISENEINIPRLGILRSQEFRIKAQDYEENHGIVVGYRDPPFESLCKVDLIDVDEPSKTGKESFIVFQPLLMNGKRIYSLHGNFDEIGMITIKISPIKAPPTEILYRINLKSTEFIILIHNLPFCPIEHYSVEMGGEKATIIGRYFSSEVSSQQYSDTDYSSDEHHTDDVQIINLYR